MLFNARFIMKLITQPWLQFLSHYATFNCLFICIRPYCQADSKKTQTVSSLFLTFWWRILVLDTWKGSESISRMNEWSDSQWNSWEALEEAGCELHGEAWECGCSHFESSAGTGVLSAEEAWRKSRRPKVFSPTLPWERPPFRPTWSHVSLYGYETIQNRTWVA